MKNIFNKNRPLFLTSLVSVLIILFGLIYGVSLTSYKDYKDKCDTIKKQNDSLIYINDSLSSDNFSKDIEINRYEIILDRLQEIKQDSIDLEEIEKTIE